MPAQRHAVAEEPLALAEDQRVLPEAELVDQIGGEQCLEKLAAAPDVQLGPGGGSQPPNSVDGVTADALRARQSNLSRLFVTTYVVALVKAFATGWSPA